MTNINHQSLTLNGVEYIRKDSINADPILHMSENNVCIIRCRNAGVHAGTIQEIDLINGLVTVTNSRRMWKWISKATLSEIAMFGPVNPRENKYGCVLPINKFNKDDICEIITCTEVAAKLIAAVPVWDAQ
jgi:hypothetical protein